MSQEPPQTASPPPGAAEGIPAAGPRPRRRSWWWAVDVLAVALLFGAALPVRFGAARGDLWLDEADYALASVRGFEGNRWDRSDVPRDPTRLERLRHYHPPLVAYAVVLARRRGVDEGSLRLPFVLAGALSVGVVYLCGLPLFALRLRAASAGASDSRSAVAGRIIAFACAAVVLITPSHIRASSHALPWAFIVLWLLALLWTLSMYAETARAGWLVGAFGALGALFVTSEVFYPALLGAAAATPILFRRHLRDRPRGLRALAACAIGAAVFALIAWALWPAGLLGDSVAMLRHYVAMAGDPFPVFLRGRWYERAPKWAYVYWYWHFYKAYLAFYAAGAAAALWLLVRRRLSPSAGVLLLLGGAVLLSAHRAHIIGPEYLAHATPFLALVGGLLPLALAQWLPTLGAAVALAAAAGVAFFPVTYTLAGMSDRSRIPRWPDAARFIAGRWQPNDRMLAPAYGSPGRWYVLHMAGVPAREWQVQALPERDARPPLLHDMASGVYRFVAVGNTFTDWPEVDNRVRLILRRWPVVWRSDEHGTGPSRLVVYQLPRGVTHYHPLPIPD